MHSFYNLNPNHNTAASEHSVSVSLDLNTPLSNDEFYKLFDEYCVSPNEKNQNILGTHLNKMSYLLGIISDNVNTNQITIKKGDDLKFLICSTDNREVFLPVFTTDEELNAWYPETISTLTVPAAWLWKFVLGQKNYEGILINPAGIAWPINLQHIQSLLNDMV
ncbi:SseB family protein [Cellulosilyticum sp. I15G10I2]|uniref:SseB family protein n=1 Tax=Cellulosilyticum sp. I15G10I2 TaxID=1892843 RepID=UPI00085C9FC3|nr:SseB family protein [Cellulosilyticum sp. I15G10I2]